MTTTNQQPEDRLRLIVNEKILEAVSAGRYQNPNYIDVVVASEDAIMQAVKAEIGAGIGEDETGGYARGVQPIRNRFRAELRNHFGIGDKHE